MTPRAAVVILAIWCRCARAQRCDTPPGWYVDGARGGSYELAPVLGKPDDDVDDARSRREVNGPEPVNAVLYCTGGASIRQSGTSVWCQR